MHITLKEIVVSCNCFSHLEGNLLGRGMLFAPSKNLALLISTTKAQPTRKTAFAKKRCI